MDRNGDCMCGNPVEMGMNPGGMVASDIKTKISRTKRKARS